MGFDEKQSFEKMAFFLINSEVDKSYEKTKNLRGSYYNHKIFIYGIIFYIIFLNLIRYIIGEI